MSENVDEPGVPRSGAFMTEVDAQEETQVLRVEDETFRFFIMPPTKGCLGKLVGQLLPKMLLKAWVFLKGKC